MSKRVGGVLGRGGLSWGRGQVGDWLGGGGQGQQAGGQSAEQMLGRAVGRKGQRAPDVCCEPAVLPRQDAGRQPAGVCDSQGGHGPAILQGPAQVEVSHLRGGRGG